MADTFGVVMQLVDLRNNMQALSKQDLYTVEFDKPESILAYAKKLEGHSFQDVLNLGILPPDCSSQTNYDRVAFKGGMGNLLEERYFGYKANSNPQPDFEEAGIELKATCFDMKNGEPVAGERLVLTMIAFDKTIEAEFFTSHVWLKAGKMLLIYYGRDKSISKYEQKIAYVVLFTPPEADLAIIKEDYQIIQQYIMQGKADELSESLTRYLGACTKGATAASSLRDQAVYAPGRFAKSRAWCFKHSYMKYVLREYIIGNSGGEAIIKNPELLRNNSLEDTITSLLVPYVGMTDKEICYQLGLTYSGNKAQWTTLTYRMLGLQTDRASEFEKANISVRTVRVEERGGVKESLSLNTFAFMSLIEEEWDDAPLHEHFEETRFFFVVFQKSPQGCVLKGARFWSMPVKDINGGLYDCWKQTKDTVSAGVELEIKYNSKGQKYISNNLPKASDNPVAHVRPHTSKAAYKLKDGTVIGDIEKHADELPDGQYMTKQSFWLNSSYIYDIVKMI